MWYSCCASDCKTEPQVASVSWDTMQDEPILTPDLKGFRMVGPGVMHLGRAANGDTPPSLLVDGPTPFRTPRRELFRDASQKPGSGALATSAPGPCTPSKLWPTTDGEVAASQEVVALRDLMRRFVHDMIC